ncbi:hypothetical protein Dda_1543 [Drechslerella dactyloides]|uniref:Uncharacterized protein n=1 Tax=Drechslerella dactyloides TaxID=74499 RepID=A0AAD6J275_DREDA|nr:hypothetical protein Dda_1543 [Drechslerella dactyloides]
MTKETGTDPKSQRIKRIRSLAAERLSSDLGREITATEVAFIHARAKGYNWYLKWTQIDDHSGREVEVESCIPDWMVQKQIWKWNIEQSNDVMIWLKKGILRAESFVPRKVEKRKPGGEDSMVQNRASAIQERMKIVMLDEKEIQAEKGKWKKPRATVKGPASDFIRWVIGVADPDVEARMEKKHLGRGGTKGIDSEESDASTSEALEIGGSDNPDDDDIPTIYDRPDLRPRQYFDLSDQDMDLVHSAINRIIVGEPELTQLNLRYIKDRERLCSIFNDHTEDITSAIGSQLQNMRQHPDVVGWLLYHLAISCLRTKHRGARTGGSSVSPERATRASVIGEATLDGPPHDLDYTKNLGKRRGYGNRLREAGIFQDTESRYADDEESCPTPYIAASEDADDEMSVHKTDGTRGRYFYKKTAAIRNDVEDSETDSATSSASFISDEKDNNNNYGGPGESGSENDVENSREDWGEDIIEETPRMVDFSDLDRELAMFEEIEDEMMLRHGTKEQRKKLHRRRGRASRASSAASVDIPTEYVLGDDKFKKGLRASSNRTRLYIIFATVCIMIFAIGTTITSTATYLHEDKGKGPLWGSAFKRFETFTRSKLSRNYVPHMTIESSLPAKMLAAVARTVTALEPDTVVTTSSEKTTPSTGRTELESHTAPRCLPSTHDTPGLASAQPEDTNTKNIDSANPFVSKDADFPFDTAKYRLRKCKPVHWRAARVKAENNILKSVLKKSVHTESTTMTLDSGSQTGKENIQPEGAGPSSPEKKREKVKFVMPYRYSSTSNSASEQKVAVRIAKKKRNSVLAAQAAKLLEAKRAATDTNGKGLAQLAGPSQLAKVTSVVGGASVNHGVGVSQLLESTNLTRAITTEKSDDKDQTQQKGKKKMQEPAKRSIVLQPAADFDKEQQELKLIEFKDRLTAIESKVVKLSRDVQEIRDKVQKVEKQLQEDEDDDDEERDGGNRYSFLNSTSVCWAIWIFVFMLAVSTWIDYVDPDRHVTEEEKLGIHLYQIDTMKPAAREMLVKKLKVYLEDFEKRHAGKVH